MPKNKVNLNTVVAAAEQLNLSPRAVLHRIAKGEIFATKIGAGRTSAYVIEEGEIERLKANQKTERSPKAGA